MSPGSIAFVANGAAGDYLGGLLGGEAMQLLFLGSGTSYGVPMIGCDCPVCRSDDPRDRRSRASVMVRAPEGAILIDTSTDLREQSLRHGLTAVDAILFTHCHADHMHGIDDVRRFSGLRQKAIPVYGDPETLAYVVRSHSYIFSDPDFHLGWGIPRLDLREISGPADMCGATVTPIPILHGRRMIYGYRVGGLAYLTDCSDIPGSSVPLLKGLHTLVIDALRHKPHPTHLSLSEALQVIERLKPQQAFLTHIAHNLPHAETEASLPEGVHMAYDGLEVDIPDDA